MKKKREFYIWKQQILAHETGKTYEVLEMSGCLVGAQ